MLSEERIRIMTDLAFFESGEGKKKIKIAGCYRRDYVGFKMITTALWFILGCAVAFVIFGICFSTSFMEKLSLNGIIRWGIIAAVAFVVLLICYLVYAYRHYSKVHRIAVRDVKEYYAQLRRLDRLYKQEEKDRSLERTLVDWEETER